MKATIEIPDELYRRLKARSALDGRSVRDVTMELYERWLREVGPGIGSRTDEPATSATWIKRWKALERRVAASQVDQRTTREILLSDRRS